MASAVRDIGWVAIKGDLIGLRELMRDPIPLTVMGESSRALQILAFKGNREGIAILLGGKGIRERVVRDVWPALYHAVMRGKEGVVEELLDRDKGADCYEWVQAVDEAARGALFYAAGRGNVGIVSRLMGRAEIVVHEAGNALYGAAACGQCAVVRYLLALEPRPGSLNEGSAREAAEVAREFKQDSAAALIDAAFPRGRCTIA